MNKGHILEAKLKNKLIEDWTKGLMKEKSEETLGLIACELCKMDRHFQC